MKSLTCPDCGAAIDICTIYNSSLSYHLSRRRVSEGQADVAVLKTGEAIDVEGITETNMLREKNKFAPLNISHFSEHHICGIN